MIFAPDSVPRQFLLDVLVMSSPSLNHGEMSRKPALWGRLIVLRSRAAGDATPPSSIHHEGRRPGPRGMPGAPESTLTPFPRTAEVR